MGTDEITSCVIHPGIGIARVGNSCTEYFIGPEVPWASPVPTGGYKDASGAVKRQAARFRIYGLNSAGEVVKEITAEDAQITWRVHVANSKAAWYHFNTALDIPEAQPTPRRNPAYAGPQRAKLIVDPGAREITGCGQSAAFDTGTFLEIAVPLGEIRTDDEGRLLVLGGFGGAFTPWPSNLPSTSSDNEAWCDDVSDGPVSAKVTLKQGGTFEPYPAWVIVAPPDYAPQIPSIVTLYDVVRDTLQQWLLQRAGHAGSTPLGLAAPPPVSFTDDIYPIFARLCRHQWVNYAFFVEYGWGSPTDLTGGSVLSRLADNSERQGEFRNLLFGRFRNPAYSICEPHAIPPLYGDAMDVANSPRQWLAITASQYGLLQQWAAGRFLSDWKPNSTRPGSLDDVPLAEQPATLDRAALDSCAGGPFHPGCEATWIMRIKTIYHQFCRLRVRPTGLPTPDYGDLLTPAHAVGPNGPLDCGLGPGDVTKWMSVPWHTDTASCRSGYDATFDLYIPTFWPTVSPNHVLTEEDYNVVIDETQSAEVRSAAFNNRPDWLRHIARPNQRDSLQLMLTKWFRLAIVTERPGPTIGDFPASMLVETGLAFTDPPVHYAHPSQWDPHL
jgi:L-Lysine epsilon oxidase N-terminal/L-lysine epsilon oxidase C-terminal domain